MNKIFYFLFALLVLGGCKAQYSLNLKEYTCKKNAHDFKPNSLQFKSGDYSVIYACKFTEDSKYDLGDSDQYDWCKGAGFSNELLSNTKNSAMWGWRYNPTTDYFEVTGYFNKDKKSFYSENAFNKKMLKVKTDELFFVILTKNRDEKTYSIKIFIDPHSEVLVYTLQFDKLKSIDRNIGSWFGGNRKAPKILKIYWTEYKTHSSP